MQISQNEKRYARLIAYSIAFIILLVVVGVLLFYVLYVYKIVPAGFLQADRLVEAAVAAVLGFVVITALGREIGAISSRLFGQKHANMIIIVFRFVSYIVLALVILAIFGASPTALLAGGTFAGLVLGLAAQTVLSNIIAGVMIILARPYAVNDRITFFTWQYGLIVPTYPPKFFSHDSLMPGYSGEVLYIDLAYTKLQLDDGPMIKVPNSIMVQAAIVSHELKERLVRAKYEIPNTIDPNVAIEALSETLKKNQWITKPESIVILINSTTPTSYIVSIDSQCKGNMEEQPRSSILLDVMQVVSKLKKEHEEKELASQTRAQDL
ncbi:MAG: mechanosensitive ion channel family protein [Nitrososphaerota archaeon]|nr:mechanosensitive ion channel family protein [Nitrososphaerota archaeon]MDG6922190.1 mechanosensitive ion channel family protein [Nitrososphaerota archaeon]